MSESIAELKSEVKVLTKSGEAVTDKVADLEKENTQLKTQISSIYDFVHRNYEPLMEFVNAISEMPEFEEAKKRLLEAKADEGRIRVDEQDRPERTSK
jgi:septal ring factor EnvC (AmiA/AmiB activator)